MHRSMHIFPWISGNRLLNLSLWEWIGAKPAACPSDQAVHAAFHLSVWGFGLNPAQAVTSLVRRHFGQQGIFPGGPPGLS